MCVMSTPKAPPPVVVPPAPTPVAPPQTPSGAAQPEPGDRASEQARVQERQKRLRSSQSNNTLVTGGQGVQDQAYTGTKSLFGQ